MGYVGVLEGSFDVDLFITLCFCGYCFLGSFDLVMFESWFRHGIPSFWSEDVRCVMGDFFCQTLPPKEKVSFPETNRKRHWKSVGGIEDAISSRAERPLFRGKLTVSFRVPISQGNGGWTSWNPVFQRKFRELFGVFLKWWYPQTPQNDHF